MEDNKKRSANSAAKSTSPKKQRVSDKGSKGKRNQKKTKDGPKRPLTAYLRFAQAQRLVLAEKKLRGEEVPTRLGDQSKLISQLWNKMSPEEKHPYVQQHQAEQEKYRKEVQKRSGRDENKPKRRMSAFIYFLGEFRKLFHDCSPEERKKIPTYAGEKWAQMTTAEKKQYTDKADEGRNEYLKEMDVYKKQQAEKNKKAKLEEQVKQDSESDDEEDEEEDENDEDEDDDEDEESD